MFNLTAYIASPYTNGDKIENVNLQLDVANELMKRGIAPHVPLLNHFQHLRHPNEEDKWLELDFVFLKFCDILIRMKPIKDGKEIPSYGADQEEQRARELGIPIYVFHTIEELILWLNTVELEKNSE